MLILLICHLSQSGEHNEIKLGMDYSEIIHSNGKAKTSVKSLIFNYKKYKLSILIYLATFKIYSSTN